MRVSFFNWPFPTDSVGPGNWGFGWLYARRIPLTQIGIYIYYEGKA